MRPSFVRSKSAPQSSSSSTRSGASWAWSWAIRQLFSILPPRMVSRKWTCQLSSGHRLPSAAAAPPTAITVWALPSRDLQTTATFAPASWAAIAARRPEPPAPITTTSYWCFSTSVAAAPAGFVSGEVSVISEEPRVVERAGRDQEHVQIGDRDGEQREPGVLGVVGVQPRDPIPHPVADRVLAEVPELATHDVAARVARERVQPDQDDVGQEDQRAEAHVDTARLALGRPEGEDGVVG